MSSALYASVAVVRLEFSPERPYSWQNYYENISRYIHTINRYIQILNIMERGKFEHGEGHLGRKLHPCPLYSCRWWDNPYVPVMTISFSAQCVVNNQHLDNRTNIYEQTSVQSKPYTVHCKQCSLNYSIHYIYCVSSK